MTTPDDILRRLLGPLDGAAVAGGCDHCDAYQTAHREAPAVWVIRVHHDPWCPRWREGQGLGGPPRQAPRRKVRKARWNP